MHAITEFTVGPHKSYKCGSWRVAAGKPADDLQPRESSRQLAGPLLLANDDEKLRFTPGVGVVKEGLMRQLRVLYGRPSTSLRRPELVRLTADNYVL